MFGPQIRQFEKNDRDAVRRISCETAFLGIDRRLFIDDDEVLADALTMYYTDYEPESCFVAESDGKVIGYIIGTTHVEGMEKIFFSRILPQLVRKVFQKGVLARPPAWGLLGHVLLSAIKGEFRAPHFTSHYPAMLHINIDPDFRGQKLGKRLIEHYVAFLKAHDARGVHFGSMSPGAKEFFLKMGFDLLFESKRTYLKYRIGKIIPFYIFGKKFGGSDGGVK